MDNLEILATLGTQTEQQATQTPHKKPGVNQGTGEE